VMNGFRTELLGKILGFNGHIVAQPLEAPLIDWKDVAERIGQAQGVRLAVPVVDGPALASSSNASGVLVRGIRAADLIQLPSIANDIKHGSLDHFDEGQGVAIGQGLADQLSVHAGESITLVAQRGAVTPMGMMPRVKKYRVAAVFEIGMSEYDAGVIFMPIAEAQAFFNCNQDVTAIEVFTANPDRVDLFRKTVAEAAGRPIFLVDWRQRNTTFFNALEVERNVMFLILSLIVLVAALNIVAGLIMLVKDKGSDIAILRTMGASQGAIMRTFMNRRGGDAGRFRRRASRLQEYRRGPAIVVLADAHRVVPAKALFFVKTAGGDRSRGVRSGRDHGANPVIPRNAISIVASRAARSRRGSTTEGLVTATTRGGYPAGAFMGWIFRLPVQL